MLGLDLAFENRGVAHDAGEQVVEVVRDVADQPAEAFHALRVNHAVLVFEERARLLRAVDGVADRALELRGGQLALDQVVGGAGAHRLLVDAEGALAGQEDDRFVPASGLGRDHQIEAALAGELIVEDEHVVRAAGFGHLRQRVFVAGDQLDLELRFPGVSQHRPRQQGVCFVVFNEENPYFGHGFAHLSRLRCGPVSIAPPRVRAYLTCLTAVH